MFCFKSMTINQSVTVTQPGTSCVILFHNLAFSVLQNGQKSHTQYNLPFTPHAILQLHLIHTKDLLESGVKKFCFINHVVHSK